MVKGGKRYSSMSNDGKWFAHPVSPGNETGNRDTSTSTGIMLSQVKSTAPQDLNFKRYTKKNPQQTSREYPLSDHDNKHIFKDNISVFTHGVGRRKYLYDHSQQNSHFCLCHDDDDANSAEEPRNNTIYQTDFKVKQAVNGPTTSTRRFPRNHKQKSAEAALARAGEQFMWFGRDDSVHPEPLHVLAATNHSAPSKP